MSKSSLTISRFVLTSAVWTLFGSDCSTLRKWILQKRKPGEKVQDLIRKLICPYRSCVQLCSSINESWLLAHSLQGESRVWNSNLIFQTPGIVNHHLKYGNVLFIGIHTTDSWRNWKTCSGLFSIKSGIKSENLNGRIKLAWI